MQYPFLQRWLWCFCAFEVKPQISAFGGFDDLRASLLHMLLLQCRAAQFGTAFLCAASQI